MIMLMQAGMQANQFASIIDRASILPKIAQAKVHFLSRLKETCSLIFVSKEKYIRKTSHL